jgi:hypothetical protein
MRFQKEVQGRNVPFLIQENERIKSMKPYRSKSRLFALQTNNASAKKMNGTPPQGKMSPISKRSAASSAKRSKRLSSVGE